MVDNAEKAEELAEMEAEAAASLANQGKKESKKDAKKREKEKAKAAEKKAKRGPKLSPEQLHLESRRWLARGLLYSLSRLKMGDHLKVVNPKPGLNPDPLSQP